MPFGYSSRSAPDPAPDPALAPAGSLRSFYLENSYGQLTLDFTVFGWIDVPGSRAYYADGQFGLTTRIWQALKSALSQADAVIDFSDFDAATLTGYKSVIWFSGAMWGADAAGPGPAGEAALAAYRTAAPACSSAPRIIISTMA